MVIPKSEKPKTFRLFVPVPNVERYSDQDRSPIAYTTEDWMMIPGVAFVPPNTVVLMQVTEDREDRYDY